MVFVQSSLSAPLPIPTEVPNTDANPKEPVECSQSQTGNEAVAIAGRVTRLHYLGTTISLLLSTLDIPNHSSGICSHDNHRQSNRSISDGDTIGGKPGYVERVLAD